MMTQVAVPPQTAAQNQPKSPWAKIKEKASMRNVTLFKRFPKMRFKPTKEPPIDAEKQKEFSVPYQEEFAAAEKVLHDRFARLDEQAERMQNQFRRQQVILILGGALITMLGAVQAAFNELRVPGVLEAIIAGSLTIFAYYVRDTKTQQKYLDNRLKAEELRGELFLFLAQVSPYDEGSLEKRQRLLEKRAVQIESHKGDV